MMASARMVVGTVLLWAVYPQEPAQIEGRLLTSVGKTSAIEVGLNLEVQGLHGFETLLTTVTDGTGHFRFTGLRRGIYRIAFPEVLPSYTRFKDPPRLMDGKGSRARVHGIREGERRVIGDVYYDDESEIAKLGRLCTGKKVAGFAMEPGVTPFVLGREKGWEKWSHDESLQLEISRLWISAEPYLLCIEAEEANIGRYVTRDGFEVSSRASRLSWNVNVIRLRDRSRQRFSAVLPPPRVMTNPPGDRVPEMLEQFLEWLVSRGLRRSG